MEPAPSTADRPNRNTAFAAALLDEFFKGGVRHVCVSPGSRSAPLAVAAAQTPGLSRWVHVDERSAGFFALGLAEAGRSPALVICTSGTAAANLMPAVVEACSSGVPLIVATADRPPESRGWGTPQTIDQLKLFGSHVRWFADAPPPQPGSAGLRYARALAGRARAEACGDRPGPVHLNLPFREPLDPSLVEADQIAAPERDDPGVLGRGPHPYVVHTQPERRPDAALLERLAHIAREGRRGVIVCGPDAGGEALARSVARLGRAAAWPVLADPTSQLRFGAHTHGAPIVSRADAFLRDDGLVRRLAPNLVLRIGAVPTSKPVQRWLGAHPNTHTLLLDSRGRWSDPLQLASECIDADPARICDALAAKLEADAARPGDPSWLGAFLAAEKCSVQALAARLGTERGLLSAQIAQTLFAALPGGASLFLASSMAVRNADAFMPVSEKPVRVFANRGANGIDGTLSTALGASAAGSGPLALLIGDLALLHDLSGLLAARRYGLSATIVLVNDDGGSIFSNLPIAAYGEQVAFDELFRVRHGFDFVPAARAYGADASRVCSRAELDAALRASLASDGVQLIEVRVDPAADRALRAEIDRDVCASLRAAGLS